MYNFSVNTSRVLMRMSSFVKKSVKVDSNLSKVIGMRKGALVSYAEITKGIYDYIKNNDLKVQEGKPVSSRSKRYCFRCGVEQEPKVRFCHKCGMKQ